MHVRIHGAMIFKYGMMQKCWLVVEYKAIKNRYEG